MAQAVDVLTSIIKDGDVDPSEAAEAVVMLKRLDDEGVPTAKGLDGVLMLLHAQTHSITEKIVAMKNDIIETIKAGERETIGDSGGSNFTDLTFGSASQFSYNIGEGSTALLLTVTAWMAELYKITNRSLEDSSINWRSQEEEFDRVLFSVFDTLEAEVMEIQSHLIKSNNWIVLVTDPKTVGLIKAMAEGYQLLIREGMPSVMVNYFSNIVSKLVMATWDKVEKTLCFAARASALSQPWTASPGCISKAAAQLRLILEDGLDCVLTIQKVCSFAVSQMSDLCILPMQTLCNVLACFADGIVEHAKQKVELDPSSRQTVRQLLYGWQVLETLISNTVPSITKDPDFVKSITTSGVAKADLLLSSCQDHVKASALGLIAVYLDQKLKEIDEIMESLIKFSLAELGTALHDRMQDVESLIQSWNLNCVPARANPSVWSLLTSIISVGSELAAVAEPLHNDVLSELLDRIGKGFEELIKSQVLDNMSSISLQQLWLDLKIFIEALSTLESKGVSLLSLQIFLSELESIVIQVVQSSELGQHWNQSGGDVRRWIERQCISEIITAKNLTG